MLFRSSGNAITGSLVISGGTTGSDALPIASSVVRLMGANQIADTATVTVRGGAQFDLNGFNETIANLTFNAHGGYRDGGLMVITGSGTLTLTGAITATNLQDNRVVAAINGRLSLPSVASVIVDQVYGSTMLGARGEANEQIGDRKSTRLNSSHEWISRMPSSA